MKLTNVFVGAVLALSLTSPSVKALDICQMMSDNVSQIINESVVIANDGKLEIPLNPDSDGVYVTMSKVYLNNFIKQNAAAVKDGNYIELAEEYIYQQCKQTGL